MSTTVDRGPELLRDIWIFAAISISVVLLRITAKARIRKLAWDDVLMVFALCSALVGSAILTVGIKCGYGRQVWDIDTDNVSTVIMYDYLSQTFGTAGGAIGRIAFIVFVISLLGARKAHRIILWILVGAQIFVNALFILIIFLQCPGHASAIWNETGSGKCWSLNVQTYYGYFEGSFNSATDLYLAAFSAYIFWNLNMKPRIKCALIGLLGLGIFAMVASIIKTVQIEVLGSVDSDPTIATVDLERWLYIETYLVIITTSIPCLRSLLRTKKPGSTSAYRNTHRSGLTYSGNQSFSLGPRNQASMAEGHEGDCMSKKSSSEDVILRDTDYRKNSDCGDWRYADHSDGNVEDPM
ncbi:hypothetical protein UA08_06926 [Talaromyces atroroseus]|uniref:Rhodopsin domain-containing protein n=1 Tax=Talaromyces atroroseus TaxID=1441469 RepID=A0A225AA82_TALAT|nr:hypothetical protein UA08_06926 [Talaromyces atroroseus]OKL57742.1 hypothetical protein UA08_06926 [Talaromyces atroroseus]